MTIGPLRISAIIAIIGIVSTVLAACGSSETAVVAPQEDTSPAMATANTAESTEPEVSEAPEASAPESAESTVETQATVLDTEDTAPDTSDLAVVDLTPLEDPAASAALEAEAEAEPPETALLTSYSDYGFALKLDKGAEVQAAGWTESEPSVTQGIIAFSYGGVNANLVWGPPQDRTALTFLADTYNVLRASQPTVTFESISDGDVSVSEQPGVYGGFKAVGEGGTAIGGGLIGAWICGDNDTAFRMTLTGEDATVVQLRFDRLLENFACSST